MPKTQQVIWLSDDVMSKLYSLKSILAPEKATNSFISEILTAILKATDSPEQIQNLVDFIKSASEEYRRKLSDLAFKEQELAAREKRLREEEQQRLQKAQELGRMRAEIEQKRDELINIGKIQGRKETINEIYQIVCIQCKQKIKAKYSQ